MTARNTANSSAVRPVAIFLVGCLGTTRDKLITAKYNQSIRNQLRYQRSNNNKPISSHQTIIYHWKPTDADQETQTQRRRATHTPRSCHERPPSSPLSFETPSQHMGNFNGDCENSATPQSPASNSDCRTKAVAVTTSGGLQSQSGPGYFSQRFRSAGTVNILSAVYADRAGSGQTSFIAGGMMSAEIPAVISWRYNRRQLLQWSYEYTPAPTPPACSFSSLPSLSGADVL